MSIGPLGISRPGANTILSFNIGMEVSDDDDPVPAEELGENPERIETIRNLSFNSRLQNLSIAQDDIIFDDRGQMTGNIDHTNNQVNLTLLFGMGDERSIVDITEVTQKFMFIRDQMVGGAIDNRILFMDVTSEIRGRFGGPRPMLSPDLKTVHRVAFDQDITKGQLDEITTRIDASPDIGIVTIEPIELQQNDISIQLNRRTIAAQTQDSLNNIGMNIDSNYNTNTISFDDLQTINGILFSVSPSTDLINITFEAF